MYKDKNVISTEIPFVKGDLMNTIKEGRLYESNTEKIKYSPFAKSRLSPKSKLGIYLTNIRIFHRNNKQLHIKYIYYPDLFKTSLISYLLHRNIGVKVWREPGPYLPIIDTRLSDVGELYQDTQMVNYFNSQYKKGILDFKNEFLSLLEQYHNLNTHRDVLLYINKLSFFTENNLMSELFDLGYKKDLAKFTKKILLHTILGLKEFERKILGISKFMSKNYSSYYASDMYTDMKQLFEKINVTNSCLFVVEDLNLLIKNLKDKGYVISEGSQKQRGSVNEMDNFLCHIESDYLESLYNNHIYHTNRDFDNLEIDSKNESQISIKFVDNMKKSEIIPRSKFSVRNMRKISRN